MKKVFCIVLVLAVAVWFGQAAYAHEHGGKEEHGSMTEHSEKEHGGAAVEQSEKEHGGTTAEHGGKEHGGVASEHGDKEHGGSQLSATPSAEDIRSAMKAHVENESVDGAFSISDSETGKTRRLTLVRVHERVGKTGDYYYSCADFIDIDSGELLDLDLDVEDNGGHLSVVDVRIHKVGGKERYTYDENDNRIPIE